MSPAYGKASCWSLRRAAPKPLGALLSLSLLDVFFFSYSEVLKVVVVLVLRVVLSDGAKASVRLTTQTSPSINRNILLRDNADGEVTSETVCIDLSRFADYRRKDLVAESWKLKGDAKLQLLTSSRLTDGHTIRSAGKTLEPHLGRPVAHTPSYLGPHTPSDCTFGPSQPSKQTNLAKTTCSNH
jgi:hypothetical protein